MPNQVNTSQQDGKQRPEALAEFAESARKTPDTRKKLGADAHTAPIPTSNRDKHDVATRLLDQGAHEHEADPDEAGEDKLPDRIVESRKPTTKRPF